MSDFVERRWTSGDGLSLYARDYSGAGGDARLPVICLHGLTRNSKDFEDVAPRLAASGRRVIVPDVRGRGQSDRDPKPGNYQPKTYAADVLRLFDALGISQAVFVGTSMGGIITMALAGMRRKVIAAAVLNDVGPEIAAEGIERIKGYVGGTLSLETWADAASYMKSINGVAFPDYSDADWNAFARRTFRDDGGRPILDYDPAIAHQLQQGNYKAASYLAWMLFRRLARHKPTLLVRGGRSDLVTNDIAQRMKRAAPGLEVVEVPGVGHAPMLSEPEASSAIDRFLQRVP